MQAKYKPKSKYPGLDTLKTLTPTNLAEPSQIGLTRIEQDTGDFVEFLADRLKYTTEEICDYFKAEQVDGIVAGIWNIERKKMMLIGDQAGIGKGRQAAALIRYGILQKQKVLFVTAKVNLFEDLQRDFADIGMSDIRLLATNSNLSLNNLSTGSAESHNTVLEQSYKHGIKSQGYDAVVTTYSQCSTVKGQKTLRHDFLTAFAKDAIIIADEVHEAGGGVSQEGLSARGRFIRGLFAEAKGIVCLSATAAKTPEQVGLYFRTDMMSAFRDEEGAGDYQKLVQALHSGGIPLQQVLCSQLAAAGQYLRRERDLSKIKFEIQELPVDKDTANRISQIKSKILSFDRSKQMLLEDNKDYFKSLTSGNVIADYAVGDLGVTSTNFTSIAHNLFSVEILAYKCELAIETFIEAVKSGQKVVIGLDSTNESMLSRYVEDNGLKPGDPVFITFAEALRRYLQRSREVTLGKKFGASIRHSLTDTELGKYLVSRYEEIMADIESLELDDRVIPASPIDWIRYRLNQAGIKVGELTGRTLWIDYETNTLQSRTSKERQKKAINDTCSDFNNGDTDVIIMTRTGAVGLSLHSSESFKKQNQRKLFILQPSLDIANFVQTMGRVHRTGQVVDPEYCLLSSDIPSERRPNAILMKKLASLNANVTASRSGTGLDFSGIPDFIGNEIADWVATKVLSENTSLDALLDYPIDTAESFTASFGDKKSEYKEDAMRRVTGRIHLLPSLEKQEQVFDLLQKRYTQKIEELELSGSSSLSAKTMDLKAKSIEYCEIPILQNPSTNPFEQPIRVELKDCVSPFKPYSPQTLYRLIKNKLGMDATNKFEESGKLYSEKLGKKIDKQYLAQSTQESEDFDSETKHQIRAIKKILTAFPIARPVKLLLTVNPVYGVVIDIQIKDSKNLSSPSNWFLTLAIANGVSKKITFCFSDLLDRNDAIINIIPVEQTDEGISVFELFESYQSECRENRYFVTENLLAAYQKGFRGEIVSYTQFKGLNQIGMRLNRSFNPQEYQGKKEISLNEASLNFLLKTLNGTASVYSKEASTAEAVIKLDRYKSQYLIETNSKVLILCAELQSVTGKNFVSVSNLMRLYFDTDKVAGVVKAIRGVGWRIMADSHLEELNQFLGIPNKLEFSEVKSS